MSKKIVAKVFFATLVGLAGCDAIRVATTLVAGVATPSAPPTTQTGQAPSGARPIKTMTPGGGGVATTAPTEAPSVESTPPPPVPTPVPFPCEAWDGTKPTLRGEIVPLPNGGKGVVHYTACWGEYTITPKIGNPYKVSNRGEIKLGETIMGVDEEKIGYAKLTAYGQVDDQQDVLVRHTTTSNLAKPWHKEATFHRTAVRGNELVYELVKVNPLTTGDSFVGDSHIPQVTYMGFLRHLPGSPASIAGDVASVSYDTATKWGYDKVLLTPNAEARWGADEVDFGCAPFEGQYTDLDYPTSRGDLSYRVVRKVSVGHRYIPFIREAVSVAGPVKCVWSGVRYVCDQPTTTTLNHGAWIMAKDGKWSKTKIFGPPIVFDNWGESADYGLAMPVWDEELDGFVTTLTRATKVYPKGYDEKGEWHPATTYEVEKLGASFRLVTEDEIAASLEPIEGGCRAPN